MNANLPPIQVYIRNKFLFWDKTEGHTYAHLISVRSLQNQAPQFTVLTSDGALYTGLPSHAICFTEEANDITLQDSCMWDNISSEIQVLTFDTLRYMKCSVKTSDNIIQGIYLFTIDYVGENDLSRSSEHWKQVHVIKGVDDNLYIYPQYRVKFLDDGLCFTKDEDFSDYKYNRVTWIVGS